MKNVQCIRGKWVARMVVPTDLRPIVGKRELVEELSSDAKTRERQALIALSKFHGILDKARATLAASRPTVVAAANAFFEAELIADDKERAVGGNTDSKLKGWLSPYTAKLRLVANGLLSDEEAMALIGYAVAYIKDEYGRPNIADKELLKILAQVKLEALSHFQERDAGSLKPPAPKLEILTVQNEPATSETLHSTAGMTLEEVMLAFHKERSAGTSKLAQRTMEEHKVAVRMFEDVHGAAIAVSSITRVQTH